MLNIQRGWIAAQRHSREEHGYEKPSFSAEQRAEISRYMVRQLGPRCRGFAAAEAAEVRSQTTFRLQSPPC